MFNELNLDFAKVRITSLLFFFLVLGTQLSYAQPIMEFENKTVDFGTVVEGTICTHRYKFKNTGNKPLIISDLKVTCGCTVPLWTPFPIKPGDTSSIYIEFNTFNKMGNVAKGVNLVTNSTTPEVGLIILANVIPDSNYKVIIDSNSFKPFHLLDQKTFYQVKLDVSDLAKKKFKGNGFDLEKMSKLILSANNPEIYNNLWFTSTSDQLIVNTYNKDYKFETAKILKKQFKKKRHIKKWYKKIQN